MTFSQNEIDLDALRTTLSTWLKSRITEEGFKWINTKTNHLKTEGEDWEFFSSFSAVPRHTGKEPLGLSDGERERAHSLRRGWKPVHWSTDQLGRTFLLLGIAEHGKKDFLDKLEKTFISSDIDEAVALYQSLPILPWPEELQNRAAEGVRSNITSVFNAVALRNPYPADYMDDGAWNQVVLKALFVESPLYLIEGMDKRANKKLARMLVDYAHERWAAGRSVSPELWRPVGPFAEGDMVGDLEKVLRHSDEIQQQAAILALSAGSSPRSRQLLQENKVLADKVKQNNITWDDIGRRADG